MWKLSRLFVALFATLLLTSACGSGGETTVDAGTDSTASTDSSDSDSTNTDSSNTESSSTDSNESSSGPTESPLGDLLGIPITNDDEMEEFFGQLQRDAERKISECMLAEGFEYKIVDYGAAGGLSAGVDEDTKAYVEEYGFGITSNPFEEAFESFQDFEDPNQAYIETLSEGEAEAYQSALQGQLPDFDSEDIQSFTPGGCQGEAFEEVFAFGMVFDEFNDEFEEIEAAFEADPRIVSAKSGWSDCMAEAGYRYATNDDARDDLRKRYRAIVNDPDAFDESEGEQDVVMIEGEGTEEVFFGPGTLKPEFQARVDELGIEERAVALASWDCESPLREIEDDIQIEYEQKFVDQYGTQIKAALGE